MVRRESTRTAYIVGVYDDPNVVDALSFTFVPKNNPQASVPRQNPQLGSEYVVSVQGHGHQARLRWINQPADESVREELEAIALQRVTLRHEWLEKLRELVERVKSWAEDLDWATKVVKKKLEDAEIGNYEAPALLLQRETARVFLEPVARTAPGVEGVVDLYLMPSYDDIASLYYYNNQWNVHYVFRETTAVAELHGTEAKPLSLESLRNVLDEMLVHAK